MSKTKDIVKTFTFSAEERDMLQNIKIGKINAQATLDGLGFYENALLGSIYKRLGIAEKPREGYEREIKYTLNPNQITYTERPKKKDLKTGEKQDA